MDIQKFTERTQGFLQAAGTIAIREFHQRVTPEHFLKALLDDEEGAASGLIRAAGGNPQAVREANDAEIGRIPKVQGGGGGQPQVTPELVRVLDNAQQTATRAGDEYVAQDRVLVALAASETPAGRALRAAGGQPAGGGTRGRCRTQGAQSNQPECGGEFRLAEEIYARYYRACA